MWKLLFDNNFLPPTLFKHTSSWFPVEQIWYEINMYIMKYVLDNAFFGFKILDTWNLHFLIKLYIIIFAC